MERPLLTPHARQAHRRLSDAADALVEAVREHAPLSVALSFVAETLAELVDEHQERASDCAKHEADEAEVFTRWMGNDA